MFKKRKVLKEFERVLAEGNDARIEELVKENPWLKDYVDEAEGDDDVNVKRICAAVGIMEDELNAPASFDDIIHSLEQDFKVTMSRSQVESICMDLEGKGYLKAQDPGYVLTVEGGRVCDNYLNRQSNELLGELPGE